LKNTFLQYRPFLLFLVKFLLVYVGSIILYQIFLENNRDDYFEVDVITLSIANQTDFVLHYLGFESRLEAMRGLQGVKLFIKDQPVVRIIEGCNAVSVMVLFMAFVVAFKGSLRNTLAFLFIGVLIIHILNVIRIVGLSIGLLYYPESEHLLHGVVFPLFIYGVVFLLWGIWIQKFSNDVKKI